MQEDIKVFTSLLQPEKGFRYGIDSFLLARFANFRRGERICDLGAGVGILGFLALKKGKVAHVYAVEVQAELAELALQNARKLNCSEQMTVLTASWKEVPQHFKKNSCDLVISNPPYRKGKTGRLPPDAGKARAKHEIEGMLSDLLGSATFLLKPQGRLCLVYPPLRLEELVLELKKIKMKIQRMVWIHPYQDKPATLFMAEAVKSEPRELKVEAPVVVYKDPDHYSPELEEWIGKKKREEAVDRFSTFP